MKDRGITMGKSGFRSFFSGLLPLFILAHFAHHLVTALPAPLLPFIRDDFALDYTQAGFVISAFHLSYGFSQVPAGWLADRIGARTLITIGICGVAVFGLVIGFSSTYTMLMASLVLMGILGGGYHPSAPPLISASVEPEKRGRALGFHLIGGSASYFLAPLIAAAIAAAWGWRGSFIGLAIPTVIFGIAFYVLIGQRADRDKAKPRKTRAPDETTPTPSHWRRLLSFIIPVSFIQAVVFSVVSFISLYLVDHFGVSRETATAFIAIIYSAGLWASPLGGYLSDRLGRIPVILVVCFAMSPIIYLLNIAPFGLGIGAVLLALGMTIYIRMPVSEAFIVDQTSEHNRSTILGIYYLCGIEGGGLLTPAMGYLIDKFGFHYSFSIASGAVLISALVLFIWLRSSRTDRVSSQIN